jgi:DNA helicase IV
LFGPEFPDFTAVSQSILSDSHPHSGLPCLIESVDDDLSTTVLKVVLELRKKNLRQIGVVVHSDRYFQKILDRLTSDRQPVCHITQRGQKLDATMPLIAVSLPRLIGGQEFDAVVAVGIENGLVPPRVHVDGLAASLEQQALRELYLSFTRARLRVVIVNSKGSSPSTLLSSAIQDGLLVKQDSV